MGVSSSSCFQGHAAGYTELVVLRAPPENASPFWCISLARLGGWDTEKLHPWALISGLLLVLCYLSQLIVSLKLP